MIDKTFNNFMRAGSFMALATLALGFFAIGCQAVKYIGATPIEDTNKHIEKTETVVKEIYKNQETLGLVAVDLANENVIEAKKDDDQPKFERAVGTKVNAQSATREATKGQETKFDRIEGNDFSGLLDIIMGILSALFPALAGYLVMIRAQLGRVQTQAKIYASKPETFDITGNKDLK